MDGGSGVSDDGCACCAKSAGPREAAPRVMEVRRNLRRFTRLRILASVPSGVRRPCRHSHSGGMAAALHVRRRIESRAMKAIAATLLFASAVFAQQPQPQPPRDPAEAAQTPPSKTTT